MPRDMAERACRGGRPNAFPPELPYKELPESCLVSLDLRQISLT